MRFFMEGTPLKAVRFVDGCSSIKTPFSPDGQWVIFSLGPQGPVHAVPTRSLTAYLQGGLPESVVYPSDNAGMPPAPPRNVEFLRWSGPDTFEMTGAALGGISRYACRAGQSQLLNTCYLDAFRRQCAYRRFCSRNPRVDQHGITDRLPRTRP